MNYKLIKAISKNPKEISRDEIIELITDNVPEYDKLFDCLEDVFFIKVVEMAAAFVSQNNAEISRDPTLERKWQNLITATDIENELMNLVNSPALIPYTQSVILIAVALMREEGHP